MREIEEESLDPLSANKPNMSVSGKKSFRDKFFRE